MFDLNIPEEELKNKVAMEFFSDFDTTARFNNVDFVIAPLIQATRESQYFLWAEAKRGKSDIVESFIQLILTIGKAKLQDLLIPPHFLGAFDAEKFAFVEFSEIAHIFSQNDFNWNITPSNHESKEFKQLYKLTSNTLKDKNLLFRFATQSDELKEFIKNNFILDLQNTEKIHINKNNFFGIYLKWLDYVKPSISVDWEVEKPDILDSDFYLADLLSRNNSTKEIYENLRILLYGNYYKVKLESRDIARKSFNFTEFGFKDNQVAHRDFWRIYERPPKEEFWDYIIKRRDLLVPQDIRERKGAFFTPQVWVQKAQDYLADCLGESWQDEYVIWDCAAGTGNLLAGLTNARNIYASTLDSADVEVMQERRQNGANLLESNIFQFDFLNDDFFDKVDSKGKIVAKSKLPQSLQEIIKNEPQKLVIFINPPYAEVSSKKIQGKKGVNITNTHAKYTDILGTAGRELFAQFFMRIYKEIPNCILGSFATPKYVNGSAFADFRKEFKAKFFRGFIIPAWTFDNVKGNFPIGFLVWNLGEKVDIKKVKVDIFNENNKRIGKKNFYLFAKDEVINKWINQYKNDKNNNIGWLDGINGNDFQHNNIVYIVNQKEQVMNPRGVWINAYNLIPASVYFAVRRVISNTWINHSDQFLCPKHKWRQDSEFHNDCLTYTLFHGQNRISANLPHPKSLPQGEGLYSHSPSLAEGDKGGGLKYINHFIPFSEVEVGAKGRFKSDFMFRFINGKVKNGELDDCFIPSAKIAFSPESSAVFDAGRELWRYYHKCAKNTDKYLNDASLYDIKEFFQGRNEKGKMNNKSTDSHYNDLIADLRIALNALATKIEPKIYEYEFLRE